MVGSKVFHIYADSAYPSPFCRQGQRRNSHLRLREAQKAGTFSNQVALLDLLATSQTQIPSCNVLRSLLPDNVICTLRRQLPLLAQTLRTGKIFGKHTSERYAHGQKYNQKPSPSRQKPSETVPGTKKQRKGGSGTK